MPILRIVQLVVACLFLGGCASTQLNYNTLDIAGSVESLYTRQVLNNLSTFASTPFALPSQIDIQSGTVQTNSNITPNLNFPLTGASTRGLSGTVSALATNRSSTFAGAGAGFNATDGWQQNWNITPLTDANTLRNLRALYRYAIYTSDLKGEYHVSRTRKGAGYEPDPFLLIEPQCVLCGHDAHINSHLVGGWLFWESDDGPAFGHMPSEGTKDDLVDLGHFGSNELYMTRRDFRRGVLSDFILFVLPITEPGVADASKPGTAPGNRVGASANRPNFAPVPLGIQPVNP